MNNTEDVGAQAQDVSGLPPTKKRKRRYTKYGSMWLHRTPPDGAGNSTQYFLGKIMVQNKPVLFSAWPNFKKTRPDQPDFYMFVSDLIGEKKGKGGK